MEQVLVFSIIGIILSACLLCQALFKLSDKCNSYSWVFPIVTSSIFLIFSFTNMIIVSEDVDSPHAEDVINGNAFYQESYHIVKNDTIKTYQIVWDKKK